MRACLLTFLVLLAHALHAAHKSLPLKLCGEQQQHSAQQPVTQGTLKEVCEQRCGAGSAL